MRLNYTETHYKRTQFTHELKLADGNYNGFYQGEHALIRVKDGEATAILFFGGCMDGRGILKSNIEFLIATAR